MADELPIVVGVTGASGAIYAVRLLDVLLRTGHDVHLAMSDSGAAVIHQELGVALDTTKIEADQLVEAGAKFLQGAKPVTEAPALGKLTVHHHKDFMAPIASGSFLAGGTVIVPCSGTTLSAIAAGSASNLIQRAAEVALKERRRLVLVPRETPVSLTHIDNMRKATEAGAVVLPAAPGWYHGVESMADLVDFVVARICDQLGVRNALMKRWGED